MLPAKLAQKMSNGPPLNLILFGVFVLFTVLSCIFYMLFKIYGFQVFCWSKGIHVRFKQRKLEKTKTQEVCSTVIADEVFENSFERSFEASLRNIDQPCCCFSLYWNKHQTERDEQNYIVLPECQKVTYGEFHKPKTLLQRITGFIPVNRFPNSPKNDSCPICLEQFDKGVSMVLLKCSHGYHAKCIADWLHCLNDNDIKCPMCNRDMHIEECGERSRLLTATRNYSTQSNPTRITFPYTNSTTASVAYV